MTDSTNNSFEEQWQHAFDNAELTPPESVWEKIELGLKPENTLPSKPNFGNKPYYFLGGIVVGVLGLFLWFNNNKEKGQVIEREDVKVQKTISENKSHISEKIVRLVGLSVPVNTNHGAEHKANKVVEVVELSVPVNTNHGAEESLSVSPTITTTEEIPVRTLTDSVEMIEPLSTKSIHFEIESPIINLPVDQTPYYIKPTPKPRKKSIFRNVKISGSVEVYQQ